jgi:hypothetical protein
VLIRNVGRVDELDDYTVVIVGFGHASRLSLPGPALSRTCPRTLSRPPAKEG